MSKTIIWHDNDYDLARWVYLNSILKDRKEKTLLRPIPKTNSANTLLRLLKGRYDYHILPVIKYETPDVIIQKINEDKDDSEILFVTEFMTHTPQHHHPLQRFSRIYGASGLKIPSALLIPNTKIKIERRNGVYRPTSYRANPLIYHIFLKTTDVNRTPTLLFMWPDLDGYLKYDKNHPTAPQISDQIKDWFSFFNSVVHEKDKRDVGVIEKQLSFMEATSQYKRMPHEEFIKKWQDIYKLTTIRIALTQEVIDEFKLNKKELSPQFIEKKYTLVFEPEGLHAPSTPFRTDPYAGMLCAFDNLFCREKNGERVLNLILRAKNIKYAVSEKKNIFIDVDHDENNCPFLRKIPKEIATNHLKSNQCPFTMTKQQRIYGEVADVIVFDDYVYY
jgi:hypothetical protein